MRRFLLWFLLLLPWTALADGGHIALHATSGSVTITLFTAPEPLVPGTADFSVLVQDAASSEPLPNVHVRGTLSTSRANLPLAFEGTLPAATVHLADPGSYRLNLSVEALNAPPTTFTATLIVEASHQRRTTVILALLFPLGVIVLFLVNQQLKANRRASS